MPDVADKPVSFIRSTKLRAKTPARPRWTVLLKYRPGDGTEELVPIWTSKAWTEVATTKERALEIAVGGTGRSAADLVVRDCPGELAASERTGNAGAGSDARPEPAGVSEPR